MGRGLVRRGQSVWRIAVDPDGMVRLAMVGFWDHYGGPDPATWSMRLSEYGPSGTETRTIPWAGVVDVKYQVDRVRPWWGLSPLAAAHEAGPPVRRGHVSALADGGGRATRGNLSCRCRPMAKIRSDRRACKEGSCETLAENVAFVESVRTHEPRLAGLGSTR